MRSRRGRILVGAAVVLVGSSRGAALVAGGGPARSDCYAEWQVTTPGLQANRGKVGVDCQDGDPACDVDGQPDGACTFGVSACIFQSDVAGCTPTAVTGLTLSRKAQAVGLQPPPLPGVAAACGPATLATLPLRTTRRGPRPSRPLRLGLVATASARPTRDRDRLVLRCVPNAGAATCPANPSGGARELRVTVPREGTDLDIGWTGNAHNFPIVFGTTIRACLSGCDTSSNPTCTVDVPSTNQVNAATFGPPLPLFSSRLGAPVCLVNRLGNPKLSGGTADLQTGAVSLSVNLLTDVFITTVTQLCPRCSGRDIGRTGTCDSGPRQGQACRTEGVLTVTTAPGDRLFTLSSDCPPPGSPFGTISVALSLITGTSMLAGPVPCGAPQDDDCRGGTCDATCTGQACVSTTAGGQCVDANGGLSQLCCSSDSSKPCFPTASGQIVRSGVPFTVVPPWPDATYPKTGDGVLIATFCAAATGSNLINTGTGLPGAGALIAPMTAQWLP